MSSNFLRPHNNIPERLVLASSGVLKEGLYGPQKLFHLADGRSIYLDLDLAQRVEQAVTIGQEFWICKRRLAGKGNHVRWDLYLENPEPLNGESDLERDLRLSIEQIAQRNGKNALEAAPEPPAEKVLEVPTTSPVPPAITPVPAAPTEIVRRAPAWAVTLVGQTNDLVDAYAECLTHASRHGVTVRSDDVRTLLITAFINLSQRSARKGAA